MTTEETEESSCERCCLHDLPKTHPDAPGRVCCLCGDIYEPHGDGPHGEFLPKPQLPRCADCNEVAPFFVVHDSIWKAATTRPGKKSNTTPRFLCLPCLQDRIGRQVVVTDLNHVPANDAVAVGVQIATSAIMAPIKQFIADKNSLLNDISAPLKSTQPVSSSPLKR